MMQPHALRQAQENGADFRGFRLGYFMFICPKSEEVWHFGKHPDSPSGRWDRLAQRFVAFCEES